MSTGLHTVVRQAQNVRQSAVQLALVALDGLGTSEMNDSASKPTTPPGAIDFEITDFDLARRALDELPAGVAVVQRLRGGQWETQRRKPLPTDRALTGEAMDWVMALPPALRPYSASEQFPRVVNAIAASWNDIAFSLRVIDHMVNDYRGGRRGFPHAVQKELHALYAHQQERSRR